MSALQLPEDLLVTLRTAVNEILDEEAAENADFDRILSSQRDYQAAYKEWRRLAYLPKDF